MNKLRKFIEEAGWPRILIAAFLVLLFIMAPFVQVRLDASISDTLVRFGMNGVMVLAMVPMIQSGCGLNFGLPLGIIGARVYYCAFDPDMKTLADWFSFESIRQGGLAIYGGIIGGVLGGYVLSRVKRLPFLRYADLVMPSVALAQGFGRIGCFLAGCCYGLPTKSPFGIVFTSSDFAPNGVSLIPTQLISSGLNFLHCAFLIWAASRMKTPGRVAALYLMCYSAGRFVLEFFRGDLIRGTVGTLSTSQFISIFIFLLGAALFLLCPRLAKRER